jgi:hypothetical protein
MVSVMSRPRVRGVVGGAATAGLAMLLVAIAAGTAIAASPGPSPAATLEPLPTGDEVAGRAWLDAPLPADAPAGSTIVVGALVVFTDPVGGAGLVGGATLRARLYPAQGDAPASVATARSDWRGHFVASLEVPPGGVGRMTIGEPGRFCNDSGCKDLDFLFEPVEVGPPADLPLTFTSTARIVPPETITARQPATIEVDVQPRVAWPDPGLVLPDRLVLEVRVPRGPVLQELPIANAPADPGHYAGSLTLIEPGDYVLQLATTTNPSEAQRFGTAIVAITVAPAPAVAPSSSGPPDWLPLALAVTGLTVAGILILRGRPKG